MTRKKKLIIAIAAVCAVIAVIALVWCISHYSSGANLVPINIREYIKAERTDEGEYELLVDYDKLLDNNYLPNPNKVELNLDDYPEVKALLSLGFIVEKTSNGYNITVSSTEPDIYNILRSRGIVIVNAESWSWAEGDMAAAYAQSLEYPRKLNAMNYILVAYNGDGSMTLTMDHSQMLKDCGWVLPATEEDRNLHTGYTAVKSLGYRATPNNAGYLVETTSTLDNVIDLLTQNGIEITNTAGSFTSAEILALYEKQGGNPATPTTPPVDNPTADASVDPASTPEPTGYETATPIATVTATSTMAPTATSTVKPSSTARPSPEINDDDDGCIETLYGYDQTELRKAIRSAKIEYLGDRFKESEVIANYFVVRSGSTGEYGNCFRLIYKISATDGTVYLACDVYNIHEDDRINSNNVVVREYASKATANSVSDFSSSKYTVYTLEGGSMVFPENKGKDPYDDEGLVMPDSLSRELTTAELWAIPATGEKTLLMLLGYARNEMFARCGHKFDTSGGYYKHFSKYDWYNPKGDVTVPDMSKQYPIADDNIDTIKTLENLIKKG